MTGSTGHLPLGGTAWRAGVLTLMLTLVPALPEAAVAGPSTVLTEWPTWPEIFRVITLRDYNTRVVVIGATLLGAAAGLVGTFLLLRKRALLSDALSHATLPGIAIAFILMTLRGGEGKNFLGLITGAAIFSVLGTASVILIQRHSRLKDDAALGIVLSAYFGLGIALLGIATRMEAGNAAGLTAFIYGKTASMLFMDAVLIAATALTAAVFCILFFKEFTLICFDGEYAAAQGWPVTRLDFLMMSLAVVVTVIGLQAVGLILVVALLIIPPAAARFWTHDLRRMLWLSGLFGAAAGFAGSGLSALTANLPAGAIIVLTASAVFLVSMILGSARGLLKTSLERYRLKRKIARENLLRAMYEWIESCSTDRDAAACVRRAIPFEAMLARRSWTSAEVRRTFRHLAADGLVRPTPPDAYAPTTEGWEAARRVVRNHRLWEAYLIARADIAPGQVDWGADEIEHILDPEMIESLEKMLPQGPGGAFPESPHPIGPHRGDD
ncbi:iron chelate uptake ABC transporter family permease subunit [Desulfococcus sp.]|uniref:metal ABC transporter permease n=1 Tax=Desulfococcus sp. TaxID=2025834 RepID=UPI003D14AEDC